MMKVALSIGHSPQDGGAVMTNRKHSEFSFWTAHIGKVKDELERLGYDAVVCNRSEAGGTTPIYAARRCNAVGADLAVEFHFNGADTGIGGTETLYWYASKHGKRAAELIQAAMCDVLRLPDRGLKPIKCKSDRGYYYFRETRMPALMLEPAFASSHVTDCDRLEERVDALCVAIAGAIDEYFKEGSV